MLSWSGYVTHQGLQDVIAGAEDELATELVRSYP